MPGKVEEWLAKAEGVFARAAQTVRAISKSEELFQRLLSLLNR